MADIMPANVPIIPIKPIMTWNRGLNNLQRISLKKFAANTAYLKPPLINGIKGFCKLVKCVSLGILQGKQQVMI